jgi:putative flippase GtrA
MTIYHFIILGLLALALNLGLLYVVIRLAVTHALRSTVVATRSTDL